MMGDKTTTASKSNENIILTITNMIWCWYHCHMKLISQSRVPVPVLLKHLNFSSHASGCLTTNLFCYQQKLAEKISAINCTLKMTTLWNTAPCSLTEVDQCFRGAYCLNHQDDLMMETVCTSGTCLLLQDYAALQHRRLSSSCLLL
jgi:hypothetical protein